MPSGSLLGSFAVVTTDKSPRGDEAEGKAEGTVLHEILQLQRELLDQMESNHAVREELLGRITSRDTNKSISSRLYWEAEVVDKYRHAAAWQIVRSSLCRGIRDIDPNEKKIMTPREKQAAMLLEEDRAKAKLKGEEIPEDDEEDTVSVCCVCFDGESSDDNPIVFWS